MYQSQFNANPSMTLNPFTDSVEAIAVFKSNKDFLDSLTKSVIDAGGNPEQFVQPDITLTQLMNVLAINGVRFMFDPTAKKGNNTDIPVTPSNLDVPTVLPEEMK